MINKLNDPLKEYHDSLTPKQRQWSLEADCLKKCLYNVMRIKCHGNKYIASVMSAHIWATVKEESQSGAPASLLKALERELLTCRPLDMTFREAGEGSPLQSTKVFYDEHGEAYIKNVVIENANHSEVLG